MFSFSILPAQVDFFNALNNSISGIYLFAKGRLSPGPLCTANGFFGQMTVQGTDFSILLIAFATVFALRGRHPAISNVSWKSKLLVTLCVWFVPVTTALTGVGLQAYRPVSGNWCWISQSKPVLRYALNHGWRFAIIFVTISLYVYLYFYFRSQFHEIRDLSQTRPPQLALNKLRPIGEDAELTIDSYPINTKFPYPDPNEVYRQTGFRDGDDDFDFALRRKETLERAIGSRSDNVPISSSKALTNITSYAQSLSSPSSITPFSYSHTASLERKQHEIRKTLLLNAYPIAYVILWIPGIANRVLELSGGQSRVLNILQSSTQFVGLANAVTYGYNEGIKRQAGAWWERRKHGPGSTFGGNESWPNSRDGSM
ncbi:uncharacterized protein PAC_18558 [Phialocephala subalpina]|uniref:Glucose receptor Git3-like N-terminal domain-containing protein n=1 Tax=Phialocephala subalpina TaxID=576137 RepID=A0A1L7XUF7_9HELO|nr:uncharacterized protein PAC_18558 [Phialocephala subalpina]